MRRIADDKIYALKKVELSQLNENERQNALNEVRIIASMRHQNIVNFYECFIDERCLWYEINTAMIRT